MREYRVITAKQLGTILQGIRREKKKTQQEVGYRAGLAQNAVSMLEADTRNAGLARIFKLLSALELEMVIRYREEPKNKPLW